MSAGRLLPGQAAAPKGPVDLSRMYVLHHGFRRDLARFVDAAALTPRDDRVTWRALLERWDLVALLLDRHHAEEDEHLWPLLREKVDAVEDARATRVLDDMEDERAVLGALLEAVRSGFVSLVNAPSGTGQRGLVADLTRTREVLEAHLAHKERDAVAILQRYVGRHEWARATRNRARGGLSSLERLRLLPWCVEDLPRDATLSLLAEAGLSHRVLLRLGRGRFARLERAAFGAVRETVAA